MPDIPTSPFADDDGRVSPLVAAAVTSWGAGRLGTEHLVEVLRGARVLIPLVAVLDSVEESGGEKDSHMALPLMVRPDGRRGLLAFTGVEAIERWQPGARFIPTWAVEAARATLAEPAEALVLDVAGPVRIALEAQHLAALARPVDPQEADSPA